ncbi:MAG TPA: asparagine synthase-related protein [Gemmatimonadota bacterium]|nr:asparagine synthase-related protein [Gemmatimonadota bacterium]
MSAVAGVILPTAEPSEPRRSVLAMIGRMPHRGDRIDVAATTGAAAAARSITDGLYGAHAFGDGRHLVAFDGDITNLADVARSHGVVPADDPARTVLGLYLEAGAGFLDALEGEFAVVVYDALARRVLLGRSFIGNRPLFFASQGGSFWFASEMLPIVAQEGFRPRTNRGLLSSMLLFRGTFGPETLLADVRKVPPGTFFEGPIDGALECRVFYRPRLPEKVDRSAAEYGDRIWDALGRNVARALRAADAGSRRPGLLLSGGVDSTLVAYKLKELGQEGAFALSCGYGGSGAREHDESEAAARTARACALAFRNVVTETSDDILAGLRRAVRVMEEPVRVYMAVPIARALRETHGAFDTLLTGTFADILFGETIQYDTPILDFRRRWPRTASLVRRAVPLVDRLPRIGGYARWFRRGDVRDMREYMFLHERCARDLRGLVPEPELAACARHLDPLFEEHRAMSGEDEYSTVDTMMYAYCWNESFDKLAAAESLEAFHPFQSDEMYRLSLEMPYRGKISKRHTKPYVRELAARFTSREFAYDDKRIFSSPGADWMTGSPELVSFASELDAPGARVRDYLEPGALDRLIEDYRSQVRAGRVDGQTSNLVHNVVGLELWLEVFLAGRAGTEPAGAPLVERDARSWHG